MTYKGGEKVNIRCKVQQSGGIALQLLFEEGKTKQTCEVDLTEHGQVETQGLSEKIKKIIKSQEGKLKNINGFISVFK